MRNKNRVLGVFIFIILLFYAYGILHDFFYSYRIENSNAVELPKTSFVDMAFPNHSIVNREIDTKEDWIRYYKTSFDQHMIESLLPESEEDQTYIYLMIEKPDVQYFEVEVNGRLLDTYGDKGGRANLWNSVFFTKINTDYLQESNDLILTLFSEYMTGVTGHIYLLSEYDYQALNFISAFSERVLDGAVIISFFASIVLVIMLFAWKDQLYNRMTYFYFLISILSLGIALLDSQKIQYIFTSYLTFKKIIIISYHLAVTFGGLAINALLNAKFKWSVGGVGLALALGSAMLSSDMIAFRATYVWINIFLILAMIQLIGTIIYYRKRAILCVCVLLIGFTLVSLTTIRLVIVTNYVLSSRMLIDVPILIVIYITMVLFLFYIEMVQIVVDYDLGVVEDRNELGITNHMQGSFTISDNYCVTGAYATACDHIFKRRIIGIPIMNLLCKDQAAYEVMEATLESVFDDQFDFKEGFLALLPESFESDGRVYQLNYNIIERSSIFLRVTLSDITRSVELENQLEEERKNQQLIMNALKYRGEINYFVEGVQLFLNQLQEKGFTMYYKSELHSIKGIAGQYGFHRFERTIHFVEDELLKAVHDDQLLIEGLRKSFNHALDFLKSQIGSDYFEEGYNQLIISKESVLVLEKTFEEAHYDQEKLRDFEKALKRLRFVSLNDFFNRYRVYIDRMAYEREKSILPFKVSGDLVKVSPEKAEQLSRLLLAIVRNAVVHGIEGPEVRMARGKDSYGRIYCNLTKLPETLEIILGDDGGGINLEHLGTKALEEGVVTRDTLESMSEDEKVRLIFTPGISRLEDVDMLAGRGIGLYGVKETIETMGGHVEVATLVDRGTEFKITLSLDTLYN
jgi:two-component system chemotaxis sensor kinase CheA